MSPVSIWLKICSLAVGGVGIWLATRGGDWVFAGAFIALASIHMHLEALGNALSEKGAP